MKPGLCCLVALAIVVQSIVPASAATVQIVMENLVISPAEASAKVGDTIEWVNKDVFVHTATANNGDFVANAIEVLAGGEDLVGLRSRGTSARPFELVDEIQRDAQARYSAEESALQTKLKETQEKLASLTGKDQANTPTTLSPEQAKAVEEFRTDMLQTRRQLRNVQAALRSDIARLKRRLRFLDIALIPIVVAVAAVALGVLRLRRRHRRSAEA